MHKTELSFIDSLFTSTSSICVTGLIVKNTATDFTLYGKLFILFLIQIGGIGYMTISASILYLFKKNLPISQRLIVKQAISYLSYNNLKRFAFNIIKVTFVFELIGFILLSSYLFIFKQFPLNKALFHGLFHSVSAFCNAGFSSFADNMSGFSKDIFFPFIVSFLFISGGIGFLVISDIYRKLRGKVHRLTYHSRIVLTFTTILLILGTIGYFFSLPTQNIPSRITISFFHAATPRTAGFNLISVASLPFSIIFITMILMFIGGSSGGTAGGVKIPSIAIIIAEIKRVLKGEKNTILFSKRVDENLVRRASTLIIISSAFVLSIIFLLDLTNVNTGSILNKTFEVFSAFGTVGLSLGSKIRPLLSFSTDLNTYGKLLIVIAMFGGKVGTLSIGTAFFFNKERRAIPGKGEIIIE